MIKSMRSVLPQFIDAAWRRRYLLVMPVLILTFLSILGALLVPLPGRFVAQSLMLLGETNTNNPLSKDASASRPEHAELIAGVQAMAYSEYVLGPVVDTLNEDLKASPTKRASEIEEYRRRLSIDLIGNDFLQFSLKGRQREGLGRQLDLITSRFLEALTAQGGRSFGVALISKRKQELDIAERDNASLKERLAAALPGGLEAYLAQTGAIDRRLPEAARTLASINTKIEAVRGELGNPPDARIQRELAGLGDASNPGSASPRGQGANATPPAARVAQLRKFQELAQSRTALQKEISNDTETKERLKPSLDAYEAINRQLQGSEKALAALRDSFESYKRRFGSAATNRGPSVLRAPERIIVIDAPEDPELGGTPRSYVVLAGIGAGILIGLALTVAAEFMDTTVRYPGQLGAMTGVPIIARLPNTRGQIKVSTAEAIPRELTHDSPAPNAPGEPLW